MLKKMFSLKIFHYEFLYKKIRNSRKKNSKNKKKNSKNRKKFKLPPRSPARSTTIGSLCDVTIHKTVSSAPPRCSVAVPMPPFDWPRGSGPLCV